MGKTPESLLDGHRSRFSDGWKSEDIMPDLESETTFNHDPGAIVLNEDQQRILLRAARKAIEQAVSNSPTKIDEELDDQMQKPAAVFVTLWERRKGRSDSEETGRLRGCIGRIQADFPLHLAVKNAAINAATRDPRFAPVKDGELDDITIEIAILSPLEKIDTLEEIVIGRDGLVIEAMGRRGLLLPKVATRLDWDRAELLQNVCRKAGLPEDTWPDSGELYKFETIVCHE